MSATLKQSRSYAATPRRGGRHTNSVDFSAYKRAEKMRQGLRASAGGWDLDSVGLWPAISDVNRIWQRSQSEVERQLDELDDWQLVEIEVDQRFESLLVEYTGDETTPPHSETVLRAKSIAAELTRVAQTYACPSPLPVVSRGEEGSIDLFWQGHDCSLLMNVPSGADETVSVSMRDSVNRAVKLVGELEINQRDINTLVGWLTGTPRR